MPRRDDYYDEHDPDDDRPMPRRDDHRYEDRDEDYDDYDQRPRRRGGRRAALDRVSTPAIFLIIIGCLGLLGASANTVIQATGFNDNAPNPFINQQQANDPAVKQIQQVMKVVGPMLNFIWSFIVLMGGLKMKGLNSRGYVIFACIWAMFPCSECCILGIPFGIWALVVVNDELVRREF
jgi:hypothetical protein